MVLVLVILAICLVPCLILSSALERIKNKLEDLSDRVENMEQTGDNGDAKVVAELVGDIRDAVTDCQVSGP